MLEGTAEQTDAGVAAEGPAPEAEPLAARETDLAFHAALALERKRRSRRTLALVLAAFAVGAGGTTFRRSSKRLDAIHHASAAWSAYAGCMLGGQLAPGETVHERLLRMELSLPEAAGVTATATTTEGTAWPMACASHLRDLDQAIVADRLDAESSFLPVHELAARAASVASWSAEPRLPAELWAAARAAGLEADAAAGRADAKRGATAAPLDPHAVPFLPSPPLPSHPLTAAALAPLPLPLGALGEQQDTLDPRRVVVAFSRPRDPSTLLCAFGSGAEPFAEAKCEDGTGVIADRHRRPATFVRSAKDHFDRFELVRSAAEDAADAGAQLEGTPAAGPRIEALSPETRAAAVFGGQLLYVKPGPDKPDLLFARDAAGDAPLGDPIPLGELEGRAHELAACATGEALIARVRSYDSDRAGRHSNQTSSQFAFHALHDDAGGTPWSRAPRAMVTSSAATLSCRAREAALTWLEGDAIAQARCTADECSARTSGPIARPWTHMQPLLAADLDGKALLVGIADGSGPFSAKLVRTVRMRLAPIDQIAQATDVVLWADSEHEGVDPTEIRLLVGEGAALIIVATADGANRVIRVDPAGHFAPVQVARN